MGRGRGGLWARGSAWKPQGGSQAGCSNWSLPVAGDGTRALGRLSRQVDPMSLPPHQVRENRLGRRPGWGPSHPARGVSSLCPQPVASPRPWTTAHAAPASPRKPLFTQSHPETRRCPSDQERELGINFMLFKMTFVGCPLGSNTHGPAPPCPAHKDLTPKAPSQSLSGSALVDLSSPSARGTPNSQAGPPSALGDELGGRDPG